MARASRRRSNTNQRTPNPLDDQARQTASLSKKTGRPADTEMPLAQSDNTDSPVDVGNPQTRESSASDDSDDASQAETQRSDPEILGTPALVHRDLLGRIEAASRTEIKGWVWDPEAPNERIRIELINGENQLAQCIADDDRPDLVHRGYDDGRHGFFIQLDEGLLPETEHVLTLRCADTGAAVPGSPIVLRRQEPKSGNAPGVSVLGKPRSPFNSYIDTISDSDVSGWIMMPEKPSHRCVVLLKEGDHILTRSIATRYRPDLLAAGIGDGCYCFILEMPRSLLDGEEHVLELVEESTGLPLTDQPIRWRSEVGTARTLSAAEAAPSSFEADSSDLQYFAAEGRRSAATAGRTGSRSATRVGTRILFDVSDLIYYLGHHPNLTGIQRVQSSIVLSLVAGGLLTKSAGAFLSYDARNRRWVVIPTGFLTSLLQDLFLPQARRLVTFSANDARVGLLPGATSFNGSGLLDTGNPSVLCLLGAAWVQRDYFHRILSFKRNSQTKFVLLVHDLIPIYARETCDQGTARVFEEFMRRAARHVDHYLSVSEHTAKDLKRYIATLGLPEPNVTVTRNGSSFDEFSPSHSSPDEINPENVPARFVLFVATIEGRKNHRLMLELWRRMLDEGDDPPDLVCVGRVGWKSEAFVTELIETDHLNGKVLLLQDVSDTFLKSLYDRCLFTVFPSFYEGWGLPVGESLAAGKICVSSDRSSIPEVAGEMGLYIDIDDPEQSLTVIRRLISDAEFRRKLETKIRREYSPVTWRSVAQAVVSGCNEALKVEWPDPYPYAAIPYSAEVSFSWLGRDSDSSTYGDDMLARIVDTRKGYFLHDPLQEQSFFRGENARAGGVWAEPENWGTWLCHSGGELVLGLAPNESSVYYVFLRVRASGPLSNVSIKIFANGDRAWEGTIGDRPRNITLRIRRRVMAEGAKATESGGWWRLRLRVEAPLSDEQRAQIAAADSRVPTIGFERLIVVPDDDLKTRVDIMYTLMS